MISFYKFFNEAIYSANTEKFAKVVKTPNYRIYYGFIPIFESFSFSVFDICIILRDATEVRIN